MPDYPYKARELSRTKHHDIHSTDPTTSNCNAVRYFISFVSYKASLLDLASGKVDDADTAAGQSNLPRRSRQNALVHWELGRPAVTLASSNYAMRAHLLLKAFDIVGENGAQDMVYGREGKVS